MKSLRKSLAVTGSILALCAGMQTVQAQNGPPGGGNFDPAQIRQQIMDRMREQFDVKDDGEWKVLEERIQKVMDAQRATRGGFGGGGRGGPGGAGGQGGAGRGGFGGQANPEADALRAAIEAKAPASEITEKLAKLRASRKEAEAKLEAAQEDLKKVLSVRQEAVAILAGLLK